ncbi:hypothetical protein KFZ58_18265 [Virgibacillus sp. NKC19-16]|uniref:hypothetical protein n=1 Tax=Virgibacillus salidurans TaxID=2831673 RepID=UPI001F29C538|nr:hypothetical protein [Virgibacillus sp. NKC19-16]UJL46271.1 hypothetical protein KFZ58_18265 [Virgibacillus sp. NKC19-16]
MRSKNRIKLLLLSEIILHEEIKAFVKWVNLEKYSNLQQVYDKLEKIPGGDEFPVPPHTNLINKNE